MSDGELKILSIEDVDVLAGLPGRERERVPGDLADALRTMRLADHHVHGCYTADISRAQFEESINEGSPEPIPAFMTQFDSQLGFAIRRWCSPLLGLERHAGADDYWARRASLPRREVNRAMLTPAGASRWYLDTGFKGNAISSAAEMTEDSGVPGSEILRLEVLAEGVLDAGVSPAGYADAFRAALRAEDSVVGYKTIAAYRTGFDIDWTRPSDAEVARAVEAWSAATEGPARLMDPRIIAFGIHEAADLRRPVQFHVGFGDRDMDLHRSNPMYLLDLLRQPALAGTPVMLLHCYPYHREAGYLSQAFDDVYFDVGLALNYVGAQSRQVVAESLESGAFAKQLYSSDAFGLSELHVLGSILWRRSMAQVLGAWVREGDWSEADAIRVARMIGRDNAERVYGI
jgi:predicted TIM-barrel fold metal-dependent hydrolase